MPQECKNCGSNFPYNKEIDGKVRNLSSRKYCLECSPFGGNNRKTLEETEDEAVISTCRKCGRDYEYNRAKGHRKTLCNSCRQKKKREERREKFIEMLGGECSQCGFSECYRALDFHHVNPEEKEFIISGNETRALEDVKKEVRKCILLCKNCHTIKECDNCV